MRTDGVAEAANPASQPRLLTILIRLNLMSECSDKELTLLGHFVQSPV